MDDFYRDSFDCEIQCEEFYGDEFHHCKVHPEEDLDWVDAHVDDVFVDGEPLDGDYLDRMIDEIPF